MPVLFINSHFVSILTYLPVLPTNRSIRVSHPKGFMPTYFVHEKNLGFMSTYFVHEEDLCLLVITFVGIYDYLYCYCHDLWGLWFMPSCNRGFRITYLPWEDLCKLIFITKRFMPTIHQRICDYLLNLKKKLLTVYTFLPLRVCVCARAHVPPHTYMNHLDFIVLSYEIFMVIVPKRDGAPVNRALARWMGIEWACPLCLRRVSLIEGESKGPSMPNAQFEGHKRRVKKRYFQFIVRHKCGKIFFSSSFHPTESIFF